MNQESPLRWPADMRPGPSAPDLLLAASSQLTSLTGGKVMSRVEASACGLYRLIVRGSSPEADFEVAACTLGERATADQLRATLRRPGVVAIIHSIVAYENERLAAAGLFSADPECYWPDFVNRALGTP